VIRFLVMVGVLALMVAASSGCNGVPPVDPSLNAPTPRAIDAWRGALDALGRNDLLVAIPQLHEVKTQAPNFIKGHVLYQDAMIEAGRITELEKEYPLTSESRTALSLTLSSRIAPSERIRINRLRKAIEINPHLAWAHYALGFEYTWKQESNLVLAEKHLKKAVRIDPDLAEAHVALSLVFRKMFREAEAAAECERYLELCKKDALRWLKLGIYRHRIGKTDLAKAAFEKVLALSQEVVQRAIRRREVILTEEQLAKYEEAFPLHYSARVNLSDICLAEKKYQEAVTILNAAVKEEPKRPDAHFNLGIAHENLKQEEKAQKHWRRYLDLGGKQQERVKAWIEVLVRKDSDPGQYENT